VSEGKKMVLYIYIYIYIYIERDKVGFNFILGRRNMPTSGMLRCVALVIGDVSEELIASIIGVTRISELGT
jgi:uncharacterized integral membrane protein